MSNKDCRPSTLRAVIEAIESDVSLAKAEKTNLTTGIRTFCRCVGRDPSEIDANPAALRAIARQAKPKLQGIGDAHFNNSMSRLRKGLAHVGIPVDRRRNMPLSDSWEGLLNAVDKAKRLELRKFAGSCSARGIEPAAVTQDVFGAYYKSLEEQSIQHNLRERWHRARRAWNDAVAIEGSGYPHIENPFDSGEKLTSLADFSAGFVAELQGYREALTKATIFRPQAAATNAVTVHRGGLTQRFSARRKPLSAVTAKGYAGNLVLLAGYLVRDGVPLEHFASLGSLLDPELVERGIERMQNDILATRAEGGTRRAHGKETAPHDPNEPLPIVTQVAFAVLSLAKFLKPDSETFAAIKAIASSTRVRRKGMTMKNKARLNQLADPRAKSLLLNLPAVVFSRYAGVAKPTFKQAREVQDAAVLAVLLELPLRMKNIAYLDLDRHFHRPVSGAPCKWLVTIPGHEVKNDQDINGEFTEETSAMLDRYVSVFRLVLATQPSSVLFVSRTGQAKRTTTWSTQFCNFIRRETGFALNPHIMRHFAANNWLDAHPDDAETARQLLTHGSIDTTRKFYADVNQRRSYRLYHDLLDSMKAASVDAPKRSFEFGRRRQGGAK